MNPLSLLKLLACNQISVAPFTSLPMYHVLLVSMVVSTKPVFMTSFYGIFCYHRFLQLLESYIAFIFLHLAVIVRPVWPTSILTTLTWNPVYAWHIASKFIFCQNFS